jgi:predicted nucleic acid-binding protein
VTGRRPLICDTSGLLALSDASDPDHESVAAVVDVAAGPFVVSPFVLAEIDSLLRARLSATAAQAFADDVATGAFVLAPLDAGHVADCVDLDRSYHDLGLGLTDAHLVILAREYDTVDILSLDERHLRAVRPLRSGPAFRLLPSDR